VLALFAPSHGVCADLDSAWQFSDALLEYLHLNDEAVPDTMKWRFFNDAFSIMEQKSVIQKDTIIDTKIGYCDYAMPSDYVQDAAWSATYFQSGKKPEWPIYGLLRLLSGNYYPWDPANLNKQKHFSMWDTTLTVFPVPDAVDSIKVEYGARINRFYGDTNTTNLPQHLRTMAVFFACKVACISLQINTQKKSDIDEMWREQIAILNEIDARLRAAPPQGGQ